MIFRKRSSELFSAYWVDWSRLVITADVAPLHQKKRISILARHSGHGSTLAGHSAMPGDRASRHNTRGHTNIRVRDNMVDRQPRPRLSFLHSTGRDRSKGHSPDMGCNNLHS